VGGAGVGLEGGPGGEVGWGGREGDTSGVRAGVAFFCVGRSGQWGEREMEGKGRREGREEKEEWNETYHHESSNAPVISGSSRTTSRMKCSYRDIASFPGKRALTLRGRGVGGVWRMIGGMRGWHTVRINYYLIIME
jgi:hypothetical protein